MSSAAKARPLPSASGGNRCPGTVTLYVHNEAISSVTGRGYVDRTACLGDLHRVGGNFMSREHHRVTLWAFRTRSLKPGWKPVTKTAKKLEVEHESGGEGLHIYDFGSSAASRVVAISRVSNRPVISNARRTMAAVAS